MSSASDFVRRCSILQDGFVGHPGAVWRLGTVLMLRSGHAIAAVQKAGNDPAYRFANGWSLPGGMVRLGDWTGRSQAGSAESVLSASLAARADSEAGIVLADCNDVALSGSFGPIVSSYVAKGAERFTLIAMHCANALKPAALKANDRSVQDARWLTPPYPWDRFTPANCILIAHATWPDLDLTQRDVARPAIEAALVLCRQWGRAMGWSILPAPWSAEGELVQWRESWNVVQVPPAA
jgi:hypothetical protein